MVSGIGGSVGKVTNSAIDGDVSGALTNASGATAFIPGPAGRIVSSGLNAGGTIVT